MRNNNDLDLSKSCATIQKPMQNNVIHQIYKLILDANRGNQEAAIKACTLIMENNVTLTQPNAEKDYTVPRKSKFALDFDIKCSRCKLVIHSGSDYYYLNKEKMHERCAKKIV